MLSLSKSESGTCSGSNFLSTKEKIKVTIFNYVVTIPLLVEHIAFFWKLFYYFHFKDVNMFYLFRKVSCLMSARVKLRGERDKIECSEMLFGILYSPSEQRTKT